MLSFADDFAGDMMYGFENMELEYALALLGMKELPGIEMQNNPLVKWVNRLSEEKGEAYVRQQDEQLILKWINMVEEFVDEHRYEGFLS